MEKSKFERFITKYNLNGACDSVSLKVADGKMSVRAQSDDKNVLCEVEAPAMGLADGVYNIYGTGQLESMLNVLREDTVNVTVKKTGDRATGLEFSDNKTEVTFALAIDEVIPGVPDSKKKAPIYNLTIKLDSDFATTFARAKSAVKDEQDSFVVSSNGKLALAQIALGQATKNSNRVKLTVTTTEAVEMAAVRFSARHLREILNANKDATASELQICSAGIARAAFEVDGITSVYYLFKVDEID